MRCGYSVGWRPTGNRFEARVAGGIKMQNEGRVAVVSTVKTAKRQLLAPTRKGKSCVSVKSRERFVGGERIFGLRRKRRELRQIHA